MVRTKGTDITVSVVVTLGVSQPTVTTTYSSDQVFLGVAMYVSKDIASANAGKFRQYQPVSILNIGKIWALANGTMADSDVAYIISSGANKGLFTGTASSNLNVSAKSRSNNATVNSETLTMIEVTGIVKPNTEFVWS
jgi:hypothetical protein